MQMPPTPDDDRGALSSFIPLVRASLSEYLRHCAYLLSIAIVRLVPFYVVLWYFPVSDNTMQAIAETLIAVPCVAALVRYVWETIRTETHLNLGDALLGASPLVTLRLLGTNLFIVSVLVSLTLVGPVFFLALLLTWSWVNLVTDQVVVIEGEMLVKAITRSLSIVRQTWPLSLAALLFLSLPDVLSLAVSSALEPTLWREFITRGITLVTLPFSVTYLTLYYQHLMPASA